MTTFSIGQTVSIESGVDGPEWTISGFKKESDEISTEQVETEINSRNYSISQSICTSTTPEELSLRVSNLFSNSSTQWDERIKKKDKEKAYKKA